MKLAVIILAAVLLCTSCAALPEEERAFAVVLGVGGGPGSWSVFARVPTYQSGGGYATVRGQGETLEAALANLDAASPVQFHPGQLRLIVFSQELARSEAFAGAVEVLAARHDLRMDAALAVTADDLAALMEGFKPATGSRLSKSLDSAMEARITQGTLIPAPLSVIRQMGERQSPVLMNAALNDGSASLSGCWPVGAGYRVSEPLKEEDTRLLALLLGTMHRGTLTLPEGAVRLSGAKAKATLSLPTMQEAAVHVTLNCASAPVTGKEVSRSAATAFLSLLKRLSAMGCDALGLGRQAILHAEDMAHWHALNWPQRYADMAWTVSVSAEGKL